MRFLFHPVQSNLFARSFSTTIRSRNLAKLTIVGRLAAQPSLVPTSTGQDVVRYALATDSGPRDNKETNWWNVTSFTPEGAGRDYLLGLGKG